MRCSTTFKELKTKKMIKGIEEFGKVARNLVDYEAGKTILETALGIINRANVKQHELF